MLKYFPMVNNKQKSFEVHCRNGIIFGDLNSMDVAIAMATLCNNGWIDIDFETGLFIIQQPVPGEVVDIEEQIKDYLSEDEEEVIRTVSKPISDYKETVNATDKI
jgi:predicted transcriptional regulator